MHLLPHAMRAQAKVDAGGYNVGLLMVACGFYFVFFIEKVLAPVELTHGDICHNPHAASGGVGKVGSRSITGMSTHCIAAE
jgi:hypothetical protein